MDAMTFLQSVAGYAQAQGSQDSANKPIRLGTIDPAYVASSFPGTLPKVTFDGESTLSGKLYPVMAPYAPQASDRVALVPVGNTYLIIGPVDYDTAGYFGSKLSVAGALTATGALTASSGLTVTGALTVAGDYIAGACNGVNALATTTGADTSSSASYVNLAGTGALTSVSITKRFGSAQTRLRVDMSASMWINGTAPTAAMFGVLVNGTDTDVFRHQVDGAAGNNHFGQGTVFLTGLAAGTYTVQGRWKRVSGTATLNRDSGNWLTITVQEVSV